MLSILKEKENGKPEVAAKKKQESEALKEDDDKIKIEKNKSTKDEIKVRRLKA